jgi:hypothetical protein
MANAFKNSSATNVSTETTLFTVSPGKVVTIISLSLANITTGDIQVVVKLDNTHLIKNTLIPTGATLLVSGMDQKIVAVAGQILKVSSNTSNGADVLVSYIEMDI